MKDKKEEGKTIISAEGEVDNHSAFIRQEEEGRQVLMTTM